MHQGQGKLRRRVPTVWLMTDARIPDADLLHAARRLPRGAAIVVRHYRRDVAGRRALFDGLRAVVGRRCRLLLAGSPEQARAWGADGHHGPIPARRAGPWLHSASVHDHHELLAAFRAGADAILISPLFATRSHPGGRPLGPVRFAALARRSSVPVIALGGVCPRHAGLVRRLGATGFAAIDGLVTR
ncbi:thiamine phosphate synthase [Sphingobium nicotianae]|uniref:Thiamine phosphate synthase n=1 Tax=Sphingobium nicotianae TaxID=2782607 RepID=A0A9X1IQ94_9SPHN|nr:thiamine phosphate synthase [Sphingobium nicotianae]MBT2186375.1 thiamine phosphate synthase [Sphingobium nicotianae]